MKTIIYSSKVVMLFLISFVLSVISFGQTTIFNEDFETTPYTVTPAGVPAWAINSTLHVSGANSYNNLVAPSDSSWIITDVMDLSGFNFVILDFQHICKIEFADAGEIYISTDNGTSWIKLTSAEYINANNSQFSTNGNKFTAVTYPLLWLPSSHTESPTNSWWMHEQFNVSTLAANQAQVRFKFKLKDGNGNGSNGNAGWFLDDIKVVASPHELIPPVITLIPPILQDTVYSAGPFAVGATVTDASGISRVDLIYRLNSTVWDTIPMADMGSNVFRAEILGQPYNTVVDYSVRAIDASLSYNVAQTAVKTFINKKPLPVVIIGTGTEVSSYVPCYGFYNYSWSGSLYAAAEINSNGVIDSIGFYVSNSVAAYAMNSQSIYLGHKGYSFYDSGQNSMPIVAQYTQIYTGNVTWTGPGWYMFKLQTPFIYNGTETLEVVWMNNDGSYTSGYPSFMATTTGQNMAKYLYSDSSMPTGSGTLTTARPNLKLVFMPNDNDYDAGIVAVTEPTGVVITGVPNDVKIKMKNYGNQTLNTMNIGWEINGVPQTIYPWSGTLLEDVVSGDVTIGSSSFTLGINTIKVWTSEPNSQPDENVLNDTLKVTVFGCDNILSGNYTIDGSQATGGTNFQTFADALSALTNCGVSGPVVFNIASDTYNERLVINGAFPGTSATNTVTFRGTTGTTINYSTTVSADRAAIYMDGAKHIRFDNLTVTIPDASTYGWGFFMTNETEDIEITNCDINVSTTSTSSNYAGIVASGSATSATTTGNSAHNILIENNTINGGYYGITFYGASATPLTDIKIFNNEIINSYYYSIYAYYSNSNKIIGNLCDARVTGGSVSHYGIYMYYDYGNFEISKNQIINAGAYGIYIISSTAPSGESIIANNMIGGGFRGSAPTGIYLSSGGNIGIYYNTIYINMPGTGRSMYVASGITNLKVLNNSFNYVGGTTGYATYAVSASSMTAHDYNNYYSSGTNFVYYGAARANLAALQAVNTPAGNDLNSSVGDPVFVSSLDLQPLGTQLNAKATPLAGITTDFFGNPRDLSTPDIGCVEYTPVAHDLALSDGKLVRGQCLNNNDSIYLTVNNIIGDTVDFTLVPLQVVWSVTGPVNTSGTFTVSTTKLNPGADLILSDDGIDMSVPGTYTLNAYINPSSMNFFEDNDTLDPAFIINVPIDIFDATPDSALVMLSGETVELSVLSNQFSSSDVFITEICTWRGASNGAPTGGWPSYLIADDYIEITGTANADISGYTLEIWSSSSLAGAQVLDAGTVLSPNGTCILAVGQLSSSTPSPANYYYHSGHTATLSSTTAYGFVLRDTQNEIVDATVYGNLTFPAAAGITPDIWSGATPAISSAGNRLEGPYTKDATHWINSSTSPQDPNIINNNVTPPVVSDLSNFNWSLGGIITSTNTPDTVVGPWTANGMYEYVATFTNECGTFKDTVFITVNIPPYNLSLIEITSPDDEFCYSGTDEFVTIKLTNTGIDTVFNFNAYYTVDGGTPIAESVTLTIPLNDTVNYTFTTPLNFGVLTGDTIFTLKTYVNIAGDPYQDNDTLEITRKFMYTPPAPVTQGDIVNYGGSAELSASHAPYNMWYDDLLATTHIFTGDTFHTPPLFNTTTYWVEARNSQPAFSIEVGNGTTTSSYTPIYGLYHYSWSASIYTAADMNFNGRIDTIFYQLSSATNNHLMDDQRIYMKHVSDDVHSSTAYPDNSTFTEVFNGDITWNGPGWFAIALDQPFYYNGVDNLMILWENWDGSYTTGYPVFYQTSVVAQTSLYKYQDAGFPALAGTYTANRPNTTFAANPAGCSSERVPVVAVVNIPAAEAEIIEITSPLAEDCSNNANEVSIKLTNNGSDPILSGLTASYKIENGTPVTENITAPVAPGDTILYTFATTFALNLTTGDTTINITAWVEHLDDPYHLNDTTTTTATLGFTAPMPIVENDTIPYATQATLTAISPYMLTWYDSPTSDVVLDTGAVFITPTLYANTPYYVGASDGMGSAFVGAYDYSIGTSSTYANTTYYLIFDVLDPTGVTIKNIDVFPSTAPGAAYEIQLLDNGGTVLQSFSSVTTVASGQRETAPVNFNVPFGQNFRIKFGVSGGFWRNTAGAVYPYTIPNIISITGNSFTGYPEYYYFFYNWEVGSGSGCESDRAEVWGIIDALTIPALDASVASIDAPTSPTNLQAQDVIVTLRNYGTNALTSVDVNWTINGIPQPTFNWTGNLLTGDTLSNVLIGNTTFFLGTNDIAAWTSNPNGGVDAFSINDTAYLSIEAYEPLCGIYHIGGSNPDFATLNDAVAALENWGITCPVVFELHSTVFNEAISIDTIMGSSAINTVTFVPGAGMNVEITSSSTTSTIKLNGVKNVIFDGSNDGTDSRNLTISNTATSTNTAAMWLSSKGSTLGQGCENITIKNCKIKAGSNSVTSTFGIYVAGTSISTSGTGNHNNGITISNNNISKSYFGIYARSATPNLNQNLIISNNSIGSNTADDFVTFKGIDIAGAVAPIVHKNTIFNIKIATSVNIAAIDIGTYTSNAQITSNTIHGIHSTTSSGYGAYGININTATGVSNILIANNVISDIVTSNYSATSNTYNPFGIRITGGTDIKVYYNSINLFGEPIAGTSASMSACLAITSSVTNLDVRNNIFANSMTGIVGTKSYTIHKATAVNFVTINHNDYYPSGPYGIVGYSGSADVTTLAAWKTLTLQDANSISANPYFSTNTNLHTFSGNVNALATPIALVTTDIDNELRDPVTPDIGADEFDPISWDAAIVLGLAPSSGCGLTNAEILSVRVMNSGLDTITTMNISYTVNGGTTTTETWNGSLASGTAVDYTFTQTANMTAPGLYNIFFEVDLTGDGNPINDTLTHKIKSGHDFYSSDYFMGFEAGEDYSDWTVLDLNNDGRTWEPGYNSTTYSHSGSKSARFFNSSTTAGNDYLFSECFNLEAGTAYKVEFWYRAESATYPQNIDLVVATDPTNTAVTSTILQLQAFTNTTHQLASGIYTPTTSGVYYFGWYAYSPMANWYSFIDDINIRILAPLDAGAISINNVDAMEDGGSAINMQVSIKNYGSSTLTSIPMAYTINGGTPVTGTWTGSIAADEEDNFTFTTPFTVPEGDYTICVYTDLTGDGNPGNDQICENRFGFPIFPLPYSDNFESTNNWYIDGANNQWQRGVPTASLINNAHSPVNVWATLLNGNYSNNSNYHLYTPKFDFSNVSNMRLGFWHWIDTENGVDGGKVQYSTNGGATWLTLGILNDPDGTNWYNAANIGNAPGFSGTSSGWQYSEVSLAFFNYFPLPVQFRFHLYSNASVTKNGWAIDDFTIYQPQIPNDAGVISIEAPVGQTITGAQNQVIVRLKNFGTETLTSIPVTYRVMTGAPPVNATWTGSLAPNAETSFTFPTTFTGPFQSVYDICSWTKLTGDTYTYNDTSCVTLNAGPGNIDGGVIAILNPTGPTTPGQNVPVTIRVKNFGLQTLNTIPVQFSINGTPQTTEMINTPLAPGADTEYTFITTLTGPTSDYQLCAKTAIPGDAIPTNDQICEEMTVGIDELTKDGISLMQNIPNPSQDETTIGFSIPSAGQVVFTVTNILGETIYKETSSYAAGTHSIVLNTHSMAAGLYYYSIVFDQKQLTRKMMRE